MDVDKILSSTNYDKTFDVNAIQKTYQLEYPDGTIEERLDFADWNITRILRKLTRFTVRPYNGYTKFTTLCYLIYGNTTVYRLILTHNGYMHPYEIPSGARLSFPDRDELYAAVQSVMQRPSAKSVVF